MKKYGKILFILGTMAFLWISCTKHFPVDANGLLITTRTECYVSSFNLLGSDFVSVLVHDPIVDTVTKTVNAEVFYGTYLKSLYPQFSLATDCILTPSITGPVDFSDTTHPKQWTVVSGNRKIKKTYTLYISVQHP